MQGQAGMTIRFEAGEDDAPRSAAMTAAEDGVPRAVLEFTEALFEVAMGDLSSILKELRAGRLDAAKDGKRAVRDLAAMGMQVVEERKNVDKLRKQIAGAVGTAGELDLDAARDEIGRRLACLRAARGD